jgi:RimK family alpha-L-glutamate ligase
VRIGILCGRTGWHVEDLIRAAGQLGHTAEAVDFRTLAASVGPHSTTCLDAFDGVLVRVMPYGSLEQVIFRMDLLHAAAGLGVKVLNPPRAIEMSVDKYATSVHLLKNGLPTPRTHVAQRAEDALAAFETLGRDVVIKPLFGSEGRGMQRITDRELAWRTFHVLERTGQVIYQQEFIRHPGWDLRAFVLNGQVIAAMKRTAANDWRTNVAQGGVAEAVTVGKDERELALKAAMAVDCPMAGVDLLTGPNGEWYVIEVNAVPGWRALGQACGMDVAAEVVRSVTTGDQSRG